MTWITTLSLFVVTALAEIVGCYLVLIWVKRDGPLLALAGSVCSLMLFAWLLTRHPAESGRVYAAYGGVYTCTALAWLWLVDRVIPSPLDWAGVITIALGCGILVVSSFR